MEQGANQAVACARFGANTTMLGQVGNDEEGRSYVEFMNTEGIATDSVKQLEGVPTGSAYIMSLADGNNAIIINGGANMAYDAEVFRDGWGLAITRSSVLLLQREVPESVNIAAARCAKDNNVMVILDMGGRDEPISD